LGKPSTWGRVFGINDLLGEIYMGTMKSKTDMQTKLNRIAILSGQNPKKEFKWLMPHFSKENLISCFNQLDGKKAVGADGKTKDDYAVELDRNIKRLISEMKNLSYRHKPIREVSISKGNGKFRTLGISNLEDKIVQTMFSKVLEAIYEPIFCNCSYGARKSRSAHMAVKNALEHLNYNNVKEVIDLDLENFFGTIRHKDLLRMLELKIKDKTFLRYIARMLKAGTVSDNGKKRTVGLVQGSIMSPILANIYAHYVIDLWFEKVVPKHISGRVRIHRFIDDTIVSVTDARDTKKIIRSLVKRLSKFGLKLNVDKTEIVKFNRHGRVTEGKQGSFDFLGFSFYIARAGKGYCAYIKIKTSKKTIRGKLANVKRWIKLNRSTGTLLVVWRKFCIKLQGHITYFGVTNNFESVANFIYQARRIFFKWINRRSQKRSLTWEQFSRFEEQFPKPKVRIYHHMYGRK